MIGAVSGPANGASRVLIPLPDRSGGETSTGEGDAIPLRRLEALSDTVFGVAMTFMAFRLPVFEQKELALDWDALARTGGPHLLAFLLSFSIAVIFWLSHHRRLALTPALILNFAFLLLVILLPITSDLFGSYGDDQKVTGIYAAHLALVSLLNFSLWTSSVAHARRKGDGGAAWSQVIGPGVVAVILSTATLALLQHSAAAKVIMFAAFLGPLVSRLSRPWRPVL